MPTQKSIDQVALLKKEFETAQLVVTAQYRGLKMTQLNELRAALKPSKTRFRVVKNTLAGIAADQAGRSVVREIMGGPVAVITSQGDPVIAAKALTGHLQASRIELKITGGLLGSQLLTPARIDELGKLPPKEQLLSRIMGQMNAPVTGLVTVLNGPIRALAIALQRVVEQKSNDQMSAPATLPGA